LPICIPKLQFSAKVREEFCEAKVEGLQQFSATRRATTRVVGSRGCWDRADGGRRRSLAGGDGGRRSWGGRWRIWPAAGLERMPRWGAHRRREPPPRPCLVGQHRRRKLLPSELAWRKGATVGAPPCSCSRSASRCALLHLASAAGVSRSAPAPSSFQIESSRPCSRQPEKRGSLGGEGGRRRLLESACSRRSCRLATVAPS
jgi:hypothetical protein